MWLRALFVLRLTAMRAPCMTLATLRLHMSDPGHHTLAHAGADGPVGHVKHRRQGQGGRRRRGGSQGASTPAQRQAIWLLAHTGSAKELAASQGVLPSKLHSVFHSPQPCIPSLSQRALSGLGGIA